MMILAALCITATSAARAPKARAAAVSVVNVEVCTTVTPEQRAFALQTANIIKRQITTKCTANVTITDHLTAPRHPTGRGSSAAGAVATTTVRLQINVWHHLFLLGRYLFTPFSPAPVPARPFFPNLTIQNDLSIYAMIQNKGKHWG